MPNNPTNYGPWAGKILTGSEESHQIISVDPNGNTNTFDLGIDSEDFDIIPEGQDLYGCDRIQGTVFKISKNVFSRFVGDMLITQAGEFGEAALFIVHWTGSEFITRKLVSLTGGQVLEHVTFAPVDIPAQ